MISTRRSWLYGCASFGVWGEIAAAQRYAQLALQSKDVIRFESLDSAAAMEIESIAAQIIPSSDGPGAREAGVIYFIDRALSSFDSDKREIYRSGISIVQRKRIQLFPESKSIAALTSGQQIQLIREIEGAEFFDLLRTHTVLGFLGSPAYGGNRDRAGWKYIGFDDRMAFAPPFGYYDAHLTGSQE